MEENYFSDESIIEQSAAMIEKNGGEITNGISILVSGPEGAGGVEVLLEYDELKVALAELDADREAMPHLYGPNANMRGEPQGESLSMDELEPTVKEPKC